MSPIVRGRFLGLDSQLEKSREFQDFWVMLMTLSDLLATQDTAREINGDRASDRESQRQIERENARECERERSSRRRDAEIENPIVRDQGRLYESSRAVNKG